MQPGDRQDMGEAGGDEILAFGFRDGLLIPGEERGGDGAGGDGKVAWMVAAMRARAVCSAKASVPGWPGLRMVMGVSAWAVAPSPAK